MTLDVKRFNFTASLTGVAVLVLLGGALWSLVTGGITFAAFAGAVGAPVSALVGWVARGAATGEQP